MLNTKVNLVFTAGTGSREGRGGRELVFVPESRVSAMYAW